MELRKTEGPNQNSVPTQHKRHLRAQPFIIGRCNLLCENSGPSLADRGCRGWASLVQIVRDMGPLTKGSREKAINISSIKPIKASRNSAVGRTVLAALLLAVLALAIFVGGTQDAQAQVGITANYNYISNGSFESGPSLPASWFGAFLTSVDKRVCNQSYAGSCSFKMVGDNTLKYLGQCIGLTGTIAGQEFKLKAWTKGKSINLGGGEATAYVEFFNLGASVNFEVFAIPGGTSPWTSHQVSATAAADYDEICILLVFDADSGKIWFDKVSLVYLP